MHLINYISQTSHMILCSRDSVACILQVLKTKLEGVNAWVDLKDFEPLWD